MPPKPLLDGGAAAPAPGRCGGTVKPSAHARLPCDAPCVVKVCVRACLRACVVNLFSWLQDKMLQNLLHRVYFTVSQQLVMQQLLRRWRMQTGRLHTDPASRQQLVSHGQSP